MFNKYKTVYEGKKFSASICIDCNDWYLLPTIDITLKEKYFQIAWLCFGFGIIKI